MVPPKKDDLDNGDSSNRPADGDAGDGFRANDGSGSTDRPRGNGTTGARGGLAIRLRDILRGESDDDLYIEGRDGVLPWLQALDLQALGACRADERTKPLLQLKVTSGHAEERLLTQLSQVAYFSRLGNSRHFEALEVGMLARCLCVPLVSVRVGKVKKQGNILCPTATRGQLNLNLLPSSNLRISFIGDDARMERLAVLNDDYDNSNVTIEEIPADTSGRSFLLKCPGRQVLYYWCSEKSKVYGLELLAKMKDLLRRKPSLSSLTGISESRLDSFASYIRAYIFGSSNTPETNPASLSHGLPSSSARSETECHSSCVISLSSHVHTVADHVGNAHSFCQGSASPRMNNFKDEMPRILSSVTSREKIELYEDIHVSTLRNTELVTSASASFTVDTLSSINCEDDKSICAEPSSTLPCCLPDIPALPYPLSSFSPISVHIPFSQNNGLNSISPYYCWCPPCPSSLQYKVTPSVLPFTAAESTTLPPLSSLLSAAAAPAVTTVPSRLPIDVAELRTLTLPTQVPDPLVPPSISISSLAFPCLQQHPIFTPFMSDPIVHIPVIDFCSSGQGYLVSAGPSISSVISPLLPGLVNPLIPKTESLIKSARETLEMLMASAPAPSGPHLATVFNNLDGGFSFANNEKNRSTVATSNLLFCSGKVDIDDISTNLSCLGSYSQDEAALEDDSSMRCNAEEHDKCDESLNG